MKGVCIIGVKSLTLKYIHVEFSVNDINMLSTSRLSTFVLNQLNYTNNRWELEQSYLRSLRRPPIIIPESGSVYIESRNTRTWFSLHIVQEYQNLVQSTYSPGIPEPGSVYI